MNDGAVRVGGGIKGNTAFHPDGRREPGCRRFPFGGTTLLELPPAASNSLARSPIRNYGGFFFSLEGRGWAFGSGEFL